jgi:hypothetical protein
MASLGDENPQFLSDLKISEPTRRIQGTNHYLFWHPEPQSCRRHGISLNVPSSSAIS